MSPEPAPAGRSQKSRSTGRSRSSVAPLVRTAEPGDLDRLVELEQRCFTGDQISRRSFRRLLTRDSALTLIADQGYLMLLFRAGSKVARIYSVAVAPEARGRGLGRELIRAGERWAQARACESIQLEVRVDNEAAIGLYESLGYHVFGRIAGYYEEDGADALRLRKSLIAKESPA